MWINLGRLLMLGIWGFMLVNLLTPYPHPVNIFINVALIFMVLMHLLQLALLKSALGKEEAPLKGGQMVRIFLFGVIELLAWQQHNTHQK